MTLLVWDFFERINETVDIKLKDFSDAQQFYKVYSPLAAFDVGYERLMTIRAHRLRYFELRQTS